MSGLPWTSGGRRPRVAAVAALVLLVVALAVWVASCSGGGGSGGDDGPDAGSKLVVFADSALKAPFEQAQSPLVRSQEKTSIPWMGDVYSGKVQGKFTYAASKLLAARIRKGAHPDIVAGDAAVLDALYTAGLVQEPIRFATLAHDQVFLVKRGDRVDILRLAQAQRRGVRLAIGTPASADGHAVRLALSHLPAAQRRALLANVLRREPSAKAIIHDVLHGRVDAAFLLGSEVPSTGYTHQKSAIYEVGIPTSAQVPATQYSVAIVDGAAHLDAAKLFMFSLLDGNSAGGRGMQRGGFGAPPPIAHRPRKPPVVTKTGV